jgi:hypothetical protein
VPPQMLTHLRANTATGKGQRITQIDQYGRVTARSSYDRMPIQVEYQTDLSGQGGGYSPPIDRTTTLASLLQGAFISRPNVAVFIEGSRFVSVGTFQFPLSAAPRRYPFDWYFVRGGLSVLISDASVTLPAGTLASGNTELPFTVTVSRAPDIAPFEVRVSATPVQRWVRDASNNRVLTSARQIEIGFERAVGARWYVVIVASIPLLLALLLTITLLAPPSKETKQVGPEALTGVFAALLAILPIRLVLVPADVTDLTLVDYWLGVEMAILAGIACLVVRRAI